MDPVKGVLDEQFFLQASPECLTALAKLVDDVLARHLIEYLESTTTDNPVAVRIQQYLGDAITDATFHLVLEKRGSAAIVEKIDLYTLGTAPIDRRQLLSELQFLEDNFSHIRAYLEPRKSEDYTAFLSLCPYAYTTRVQTNRSIFYEPKAKRRYTGVGIIVRRHREWVIALKALQFLDYYSHLPIGGNMQLLKEF